ncbi:uncharacterized protein LOC117115749 [Anneissia japonica]|uniref:uncharacterized protein LOC117115749 n=1 Tax=Anneissia japonica TaxID=1529436 RepID=UPI001425BA8F|nr:uncharacterized protein LOC117115749 [Anneissia japonica]
MRSGAGMAEIQDAVSKEWEALRWLVPYYKERVAADTCSLEEEEDQDGEDFETPVQARVSPQEPELVSKKRKVADRENIEERKKFWSKKEKKAAKKEACQPISSKYEQAVIVFINKP